MNVIFKRFSFFSFPSLFSLAPNPPCVHWRKRNIEKKQKQNKQKKKQKQKQKQINPFTFGKQFAFGVDEKVCFSDSVSWKTRSDARIN